MYCVNDGVYICEYFFGCDFCICKMVEYLLDDDIWKFKCGGYDYCKMYVVYDVVMKYMG